ncbi:hypothetical protein [Neobacillus sp. PS3-40]|nr:hypothetical protein [Neobacillus sp. PS3-40]WML43158.1 hypothetical protein RCG20_15300 [Neobacillus sp. PS3-40]
MKKNNEPSQQLSYESDGKMGKNNEQKENKKESKDFFNVTQESE